MGSIRPRHPETRSVGVLVLTLHDGDSRRVEVCGERTSIGRAATSDIALTDPSVSDSHAEIVFDGQHFLLIDRGSRNGTEVGGVTLRANVPRALTEGAAVRFGRVHAEVAIEPNPISHVSARTAEIALEMVARGLAHTRDVPLLAVVEGAEQGSEIALERDELPYRVGRQDNCDLIVSDTSVSTEHVEVRRRGSEVSVRDMGSRHGSELGTTRLEAGHWTLWTPGLHLSIGQVVLAVRGVQATPSVSMRVGDQSPANQAPEAAEPSADEGPEAPPAESARPLVPAAGGPVVALPEVAAKPAKVAKRISPELAVYVGIGLILLGCIAAFVWLMLGSSTN